MSHEVILEDVERRITGEFRKVTRLMLRKEATQLETPSSENESEITELKGYLRGLKKALSFVADKRNDNELPLAYGG